MNSLRIEQTEDSPFVNFDANNNKFLISGESRPEHAGKFYAPVISWIVDFEEILRERKTQSENYFPSVFTFKLDYFNSTSAKYIMDIILVLKKLIESGYKVKIEWHSDKRDDDMLEAGKEFADAAKIQFDFVEY
jgi:hypothetical protein